MVLTTNLFFQCKVPSCLYWWWRSTSTPAYLEKYGVLPEEISYGVLHDVALSLCFFHERSPPIIHRDLSNNFLLTSNMSAKLSVLGVAKILNLSSQMTQMTQTKAPWHPLLHATSSSHSKTMKAYLKDWCQILWCSDHIYPLCERWPFLEA